MIENKRRHRLRDRRLCHAVYAYATNIRINHSNKHQCRQAKTGPLSQK